MYSNFSQNQVKYKNCVHLLQSNVLLVDIIGEKLFKEIPNMLDNEQYTRLVRRYIDTVFRVALNYLRSPADAEDVTQTVFEKLLREHKTLVRVFPKFMVKKPGSLLKQTAGTFDAEM